MNHNTHASLHDSMLMLLSDMVALERIAAYIRPMKVKEMLRGIIAEYSDFLTEIEEYDGLTDRIQKLEKKIKILGLSKGEDFDQ